MRLRAEIPIRAVIRQTHSRKEREGQTKTETEGERGGRRDRQTDRDRKTETERGERQRQRHMIVLRSTVPFHGKSTRLAGVSTGTSILQHEWSTFKPHAHPADILKHKHTVRKRQRGWK